ncbi:WD repeat and SOCS box-containing protein 1 [Trichinella patagoniensis]|uniref:WD repeat and SOCS box-containing protein 1 n=3 Tax=Trichinella patagoniensis TaxID=990121 RepID=A0A0V1AES2_9BILA|nr:WD repeat and SOCS box-containing protein 1 [Trichinella patagoniensis]KRY23190.1 WD repeat and SOCS box-containing protein 1 [Trichinella patagoniensis]
MATNTNFLHELLEISSPQGQFPFDIDFRTLIAFAPNDSAVAWASQGYFITVVLNHSTDNTSQNCKRALFSKENLSRRRVIIVESNAAVLSIAFGYASLSSFIFLLGSARNEMKKNDQGSVLLLAAGMDDGSIRIYCPKTGSFLMQLLDHRSNVCDIKFSPSTASMRSTLLSCSRDSTLKLWDMDDQGNMFRTLEGHGKREIVTCCSWSFDGKYAASGGTDTMLIIWETARWTPFHYLRSHRNTITCCEFAADNTLIASCSMDTSLILWNYHFGYPLAYFWHRIPAPQTVFQFSLNRHHVRDLSFSADCQHMATVCDDGNVRIWSINNVTCPKYIKTVQDCSSVAYSNDGSIFIIGDKKGSVQIYSARLSVLKLAFLARKIVLQNYTENDLMKENIPDVLKNYLHYSEVGIGHYAINSSASRTASFIRLLRGSTQPGVARCLLPISMPSARLHAMPRLPNTSSQFG